MFTVFSQEKLSLHHFAPRARRARCKARERERRKTRNGGGRRTHHLLATTTRFGSGSRPGGGSVVVDSRLCRWHKRHSPRHRFPQNAQDSQQHRHGVASPPLRASKRVVLRVSAASSGHRQPGALGPSRGAPCPALPHSLFSNLSLKQDDSQY